MRAKLRHPSSTDLTRLRLNLTSRKQAPYLESHSEFVMTKQSATARTIDVMELLVHHPGGLQLGDISAGERVPTRATAARASEGDHQHAV